MATDAELIKEILKSHSAEREQRDEVFMNALKENTQAMTSGIQSLRFDFRIFGVIMLLGILALAGINVFAKFTDSGEVSLTHAKVE